MLVLIVHPTSATKVMAGQQRAVGNDKNTGPETMNIKALLI
jgi:hypothetical protein